MSVINKNKNKSWDIKWCKNIPMHMLNGNKPNVKPWHMLENDFGLNESKSKTVTRDWTIAHDQCRLCTRCELGQTERQLSRSKPR